MSCRKHGHEDENCVCAILSNIADIQDQVDPEPDTSNCLVSCEKSIDQLLNPTVSPTNGLNTIPLILYCDCEPFKGFGVKKVGDYFNCVKTFFFRVSSVEDCCAKLELLKPVYDPSADTAAKSGYDIDDPCDQIGYYAKNTFERTGICITMDLNCFCGVTCLDAIFAPRATF